MALRDQPYLPLYVQDYLTDEKLNLCSPTSQGVYIKIMCVFHKSERYGGILLKQKDKQNKSVYLNFAVKLSKLLPFQIDIIIESLTELIDEKVLLIEDDFLYQKRMVKDNDISIKRSESGKKGGIKSLGKSNILLKQKDKQNTEDEDVNINKIVLDNDNHIIKTWKNDYETYKKELNIAVNTLLNDSSWIKEREKFYPNVDIKLSLNKAYTDFWATEAGWNNKKKKRIKDINWKSTLNTAIDLNKIYKPR